MSSLLAKWRWRLIQGEKSLWKEVMKGKYGDRMRGLLEANRKP